MRELLCEIIEQQTNWSVLGNAGSGSTALELADRNQPDVVVMDILMPGMNGIEATRQMTASHPGTVVVILSNRTDSVTVNAAFEAGAHAYIAKQHAFDELVPGIRAALKGKLFLGSSIER
jgi:DNA-binding NarL/FixJ family response regulator